MIAVRAQATPEPSTRASHARVPTLTTTPDTPAAKDDGPYRVLAEVGHGRRTGARPVSLDDIELNEALRELRHRGWITADDQGTDGSLFYWSGIRITIDGMRPIGPWPGQGFEWQPPDTERGLRVARSLVAEHQDKFGVRETRIRMAAISRYVTHRRVAHPGGEIYDLVPKYPDRLGESDQRMVESVMRAMWLGLFGMEVSRDPSALDWPREFWTRNRELAPCQVRADYERSPHGHNAGWAG